MAFVLSCIALFNTSLSHADQFNDFKATIEKRLIKPFARDLGGVLGAGTFHSGRSLGFPGFDVGLHGSFQFKPDPENEVLRKTGADIFGIPWIQAEIGLPFRVDAIVHGISAADVVIAGGGLRYGLWRSQLLRFAPQVSVSAFADAVTHDFFSATHVAGNLVASAGLFFVEPYVGVGVDRTRVEVKSSDKDSTLSGVDETAVSPRVTVGLNLKPFPFVYLHGAYLWLHGQNGAQAGLGLRF
ncbi:MAG: hypothetical protein HY402_02975 [Elusimicrobia bacterium]|nr:hypothetical protein [Elusimicrobiota bacterium]